LLSPSVDQTLNLTAFQIVCFHAVHLPESFRGVAPSAPEPGLISPAQSVFDKSHVEPNGIRRKQNLDPQKQTPGSVKLRGQLFLCDEVGP
jgi:hypothetical protein